MLKISCRCQVYISAFNQRAGYLKQIVLERKRCFYEWMSLWGRVCASLIGSAGCEYTEVRGRADVTLISLSGPEPEPEPWHQDKRVISWTRALRWLRPFDLLHVFIGSFTCDVFWLLHTGVFLPALINNLAAVVWWAWEGREVGRLTNKRSSSHEHETGRKAEKSYWASTNRDKRTAETPNSC